jgi:hypothetical protein
VGCDQADITVNMLKPMKPMTSGAASEGRFGEQDFAYPLRTTSIAAWPATLGNPSTVCGYFARHSKPSTARSARSIRTTEVRYPDVPVAFTIDALFGVHRLLDKSSQVALVEATEGWHRHLRLGGPG